MLSNPDHNHDDSHKLVHVNGAKECNLKIQHNSMRLCLEVLNASHFGLHCSSTVNCMCLWLSPSLLKCLETGVIYMSILLDSAFVLIYPFSKCPRSLTSVEFMAFSAGDQIYGII